MLDEGLSLSYRGPTYSARDSKAALYVQSLLLQTVPPDAIHIISPALFQSEQEPQDVSFLFGSRSNPAAQKLFEGLDETKVQLKFGQNWEIRCAGQTFSVPDPSVVDPGVYQMSDDFGIITRVRSGASGSLFVIAGLGGRATEGSAWYFCHHWQELHSEFGDANFNVVLKFNAPFSVENGERVASSKWNESPRVQ